MLATRRGSAAAFLFAVPTLLGAEEAASEGPWPLGVNRVEVEAVTAPAPYTPVASDPQCPQPATLGEQPSSDAALRELRREVVSLLATEPDSFGAKTNADMAALTTWLEGAEIVGLGEGQHGMREVQALAYRIFATLVTRGFTLFALEIDQAHAALLDAFVQGERDDLEALLERRWWNAAYYQAELPDFLRRMREYNRTASRPLHVVGFDFKQPALAAESVVAKLGRLDLESAVEVAALYDRVLALPGFGVMPNTQGFTGVLPLVLPEGTRAATLRVRTRVRAEGLTQGSMGLAIESDGTQVAIHALPAGVVGQDWTELALDAEMDASAKGVNVLLFHRGNGIVWFEPVTVDRRGDAITLPWVSLEGRAPWFPAVQVMDYHDTIERAEGGERLRVERDPAVSAVVTAARQAHEIVARTLDASSRVGAVDPVAARWTLQLARLVVQAAEWRALVELNRDVFLAENLRWLREQAFPSSLFLALGANSHTEAIEGGMGRFLRDRYGDRYRTVSIYPLSGAYWYPGDPRARENEASAETGWCLTRVSPLATRIAELATGDILFHAAAARKTTSWARWSAGLQRPHSPEPPDAIIVLRRAGPMAPLGVRSPS